MSVLLNRTTASSVANPEPLTLRPFTKIEDVALIFSEHEIDAAPVVDSFGKCIGIVTSRDIAKFKAQEASLIQQFRHGLAFDLVQNTDSDPFVLCGRPFDEVAYHMSRELKTIAGDSSLRAAANFMSQEAVHHLLLLDDVGRPLGIVSAADLLKKVVDSTDTLANQTARIASLVYCVASR